MGNAGREVPDVAWVHVVNEVAPLGVNGGDAAAAGEHVAPFGLLVPVHLADTSGLEAHVHGGHFGGDRQLTHCYLTRPAARAYSVPGGRVGEFQVGNGAGIGFRRGEQVWVLAFHGNVTRPQDRCAPGSPNRLPASVSYRLFFGLDTHVG